jgi:glycosyltransferase involved in cell wall biosynthesis
MGTAQPKGLGGLRVDFIYPESNFANRMVRDRWSLGGVKRFVAYAAVDEELFLEAEKDPPERDPYRMVYFSHPSKGLAAAKGVLRELRRVDPRFHLAVFGGEALWGGTPSPSDGETAVEEFGLVAQPALVRHLLGSSYSICLQSREEPFGMVVTESMRAGLVVLASPVGAYPELVQHGKNGFLLDGDPDSVETWKQASTLILQLDSRPEEAREIRKRARRVPWSTARMARVWTEHWDWWFGGGHAGQESGCEVCGGPRLRLSDGLHCLDCGNYTCDALVWEGEPA